MKLSIQNTFLNRVLLALAVSVAAGGVASAAPAGTVTSTITKPEQYSTYSAASPVPFSGSITATASGTSATASYSAYFFGLYDHITYPVDSASVIVYSVQGPKTVAVGNTSGGSSLPVGNYTAHLNCTLSASGKTSVTSNATNTFGTN